MPCDSSHMEANSIEIELSKVECCFDVINGDVIEQRWWDGYHPRAYCKASRKKLDERTAQLCEFMGKQPKSVIQQYPLEMQMWWRDHQAADRYKEKKRAEKKKREALIKQALFKLSKAEREALGL